MNILFLNPPFKDGRFSRTSRSPAITKGGTLYYPIWLAYAAGATEKSGHNVKLVDAPADGLSTDDVFNKLDNFNPDLVVVDTSTPSIYSDVNVAGLIKEKHPKSFIVLVGTHPSALPEETLKLNEKIDAIAVGEYDYTIRDLANALENNINLNEIDGLVFRIENKIHINKLRTKIENLDDIPFVSSVYKKHLNIKNYFFAAANYPMVMIITGRGCPNKCFFCVYPQVFHSRKYRTRSAENVVAEFEYVIKELPEVKEIGIEDDCFSANVKRLHEICELLIKKNIKIKWYCNIRGDLDYNTLRLMKKAGCRMVTVGFESSNQKILNGMHKGIKSEAYIQFAKDAKRVGLLVHGCIMTGNPGDTKDTLRESFEFAKIINCDSMQFYPLYVYPGTEAYGWAKSNNYLKTEDYSQWLKNDGSHNCVTRNENLSSNDMVELCDYYLKKYHLRIKYIIMKLIQAIKKPSEGYRSLKSAKVFLSKIL